MDGWQDAYWLLTAYEREILGDLGIKDSNSVGAGLYRAILILDNKVKTLEERLRYLESTESSGD